MRRAFVYLSIICFWSSCILKKQDSLPFYDFSEDLNYFRQHISVSKHLWLPDKEEVIDTVVNWEKELTVFKENLPSQAIINSDYTKEEYVNGNKSIETYTAKDLSKNPKLIQVTKENDQIRQLYIMTREHNRLNNSFKQLYYYPKKGYYVEVREQVRSRNPISLKVSAFVKTNSENWTGFFHIPQEKIPVRMKIQINTHDTIVQFVNAKEVITTSNLKNREDSVVIPNPYFNSEIVVKWEQNRLKGWWYNYSKGNYKIPFTAVPEMQKNSNKINPGIEGKWAAVFSPGTQDEYPAVGIFENPGSDIITGTFLTETGDYRFLEGRANGDSLWLSCFDGSHAFLFKAAVKNDSMQGVFYSGKHWKELWEAVKNPNAKLTHPDSITRVVNPQIPLTFSFKDTERNLRKFPSDFPAKLTILQIMGSWCPNCLDESVYFAELFDKYNSEGLNIIALCFERSDDYDKEIAAIRKMKEATGAKYPFLFAGKADKKEFQKKFPQFSTLKSYPTSIFLNENNEIIKVHTGFYGPGTGQYYERYKEETEKFIQKNLSFQP
ncbi:MAG: TlpA family protein disulfide reductase [Bacteroidetes bacterium]|nr:MAG: TlpA family protein disulfide reductase [Bacteroidota bacterium]